MNNVMLTGAAGTLAYSVLKKSNSVKYKFINIDKKYSDIVHEVGDLSNLDFVYQLFNKYKPDIIFHFAAETNVDKCEVDKTSALNNNYLSTKHLVDFAALKNIPFVFISTASVFAGTKKEGYSEIDEMKPTSFYSFTKQLSEDYIVKSISNYIILRLGWLIGNPKIDQKFIGTIFRLISEGKKELIGVNDVWGSLTFADNVSNVIDKLVKNKRWGIYNFASSGNATRYDIITRIVNNYDLNRDLKVSAVPNAYFKLTAIRPKYEILSVKKIVSVDKIEINNWEMDLDIFLNNYKYLIE